MKISYVGEGLVEETNEDGKGDEGKGIYDNPLFSDEVKVDLGAPADDVPVDKGVSFEFKQKNENGDAKLDSGEEPFDNGEDFDKNVKSKKKKKAKEAQMNKYERF